MIPFLQTIPTCLTARSEQAPLDAAPIAANDAGHELADDFAALIAAALSTVAPNAYAPVPSDGATQFSPIEAPASTDVLTANEQITASDSASVATGLAPLASPATISLPSSPVAIAEADVPVMNVGDASTSALTDASFTASPLPAEVVIPPSSASARSAQISSTIEEAPSLFGVENAVPAERSTVERSATATLIPETLAPTADRLVAAIAAQPSPRRAAFEPYSLRADTERLTPPLAAHAASDDLAPAQRTFGVPLIKDLLNANDGKSSADDARATVAGSVGAPVVEGEKLESGLDTSDDNTSLAMSARANDQVIKSDDSASRPAVIRQTAATLIATLEDFRSQVATETRTLRLQLSPDNLGGIEIAVSRDAEGRVSAHLAAEIDSTSQMLGSSLTELRQSLEDAGLIVAHLEATSRHGFDSANSSDAQRERARPTQTHDSESAHVPESDDQLRPHDDRLLTLRA